MFSSVPPAFPQQPPLPVTVQPVMHPEDAALHWKLGNIRHLPFYGPSNLEKFASSLVTFPVPSHCPHFLEVDLRPWVSRSQVSRSEETATFLDNFKGRERGTREVKEPASGQSPGRWLRAGHPAAVSGFFIRLDSGLAAQGLQWGPAEPRGLLGSLGPGPRSRCPDSSECELGPGAEEASLACIPAPQMRCICMCFQQN